VSEYGVKLRRDAHSCTLHYMEAENREIVIICCCRMKKKKVNKNKLQEWIWY
jgi:hypothetical protein